MYSGSFGYVCDVEVIVWLVRLMENSNIHFVIIGGGEKKKLLEDNAKQYQL